MTLAREAKEQGWWQSYDLPYSTYVGLEAEATSIKDFDSAVVPGLLQTADYAKARHEGAFPQLSPKIIDQRVEATLTRQRILTRGDQPKFWSVLDEAVLHRMVGGPQVTMDQIRQLIKVSAASNVTLQVIPFTVGTHPAVDSTFTILELPGIVKGVVYVEGLIGSVYLEKRDDLDRYEIIFDRLQQMALSPRKSVDLMRKIYSKHQHELSCENL